jgi:hypothetical protein
VHSSPCVHHVHLNPSIAPLYLLRYSTADLPTRCRHSGQTPHCPHRTLRPTDRNTPEQEVDRPTSSETYSEEEDDSEEDHLMEQDHLEVEDLLTTEIPQTRQETQELEEGEILQTLEEGEILPMADFPIN